MAEKVRLISQTSPNEHDVQLEPVSGHVARVHGRIHKFEQLDVMDNEPRATSSRSASTTEEERKTTKGMKQSVTTLQ